MIRAIALAVLHIGVGFSVGYVIGRWREAISAPDSRGKTRMSWYQKLYDFVTGVALWAATTLAMFRDQFRRSDDSGR